MFIAERFAVVCSAKEAYIMPAELVTTQQYKDYDGFTVNDLKSLTGDTPVASLMPADGAISVNAVKSSIQSKEDEIKDAEEHIKAISEEKQAELEKVKKELEAKYADRLAELDRKKEELKNAKKKLSAEMFLLDSEIYAIRSYMGETTDFYPIAEGKNASTDEPVIIYQKIRFPR